MPGLSTTIGQIFGPSLFNPTYQITRAQMEAQYRQQEDEQRRKYAQYEAARQQAMGAPISMAAMQAQAITNANFQRYYAGEWTCGGRVTREDQGTEACLMELLPTLVGAIDIGADVGFFSVDGSKWCAIKLPAGYSFRHDELVDSHEFPLDNKDRIRPYNIYRWED